MHIKSRKFLAGILTGALFAAVSAAPLPSAQAEEAAGVCGWYGDEPQEDWGCGWYGDEPQEDWGCGWYGTPRHGWGGRHMRRGWMGDARMRHGYREEDIAAIATDFAETYGVNVGEVETAIREGYSFRTIARVAMLSKASDASFADVLDMVRKRADWRDVEEQLGISPERWCMAQDEVAAHRLADGDTLSEADALALLSSGYRPRDIARAACLARESGRDVRDVLEMKKPDNSWSDVAEALGVSYHGRAGCGRHRMGVAD